MQLSFKLAIIFFAIAISGCTNKESTTLSTETDFEPGQVWSYKARAGDDDSLLTILKVEDDPKLGKVVHIHLSNVKIPTDSNPDGEYKKIGHLPISLPYLIDSVTDLKTTSEPIPEFQDGYDLWRNAVDQGGAGAFKMSVADAIEQTTGALRSSQIDKTDE